MKIHDSRIINEQVTVTYYQFANGWTAQTIPSRDGSLITCKAWPYHLLDPVFGKVISPMGEALDPDELGEWLTAISERESS